MVSYLVTGAARGIGLAWVQKLSENSNDTIFALYPVGPDFGPRDEINKLMQERPNIHAIIADIQDYPRLQAAATEVAAITGGSLDYLIPNAAFIESVRPGKSISDFADDMDTLTADVRKSFNVNVIGTMNTINAFLPLLRRGQTKRVITMASPLGDYEFTLASGFTGAAPYSISKAGLNIVMAKFASEYKDEGFIFVALSPGLVDTASNRPPPPDPEGDFKKMLGNIQNALPYAGEHSVITPAQSVEAMVKVLEGLGPESNGAFISHLGGKNWV